MAKFVETDEHVKLSDQLEMKFYWVKVDPGNGQILDTQEVSQMELDRMHKEHSVMVVSKSSGKESGVSGFPFIIPH
jgi:hypothetical protein